jgi:5-methylcytosine-specific restriction endonuclease McrA
MLMTRVAAQKALIAMRRRLFLASLVCSKCSGPVCGFPREAEDDDFYIHNREFWRRLGSLNVRPTCHRCQVLAARARVNKRRVAVSASGEHFTDADVLAKFDVQKGSCVYCGMDLLRSKYHVDHIVPVSKGGSNGPGNIQLTCPTCNLSKGAKSHDEFVAYRLTSRKPECKKSLP